MIKSIRITRDQFAPEVHFAGELRIEDLTRQATELQQQRDAASAERETASASNAELIRQVAALSDQLRRLDAALGSKQEEIDQQSSTIADLGRQLNLALASKVEELSQFRSEFFGRLRQVLGERTDVRIVGDRFVLQSEVLFDSGTADIGANVPGIDLTLYTYAPPRVGDGTFVKFFDAHVPVNFRIVNRPDIVPRLPPLYDPVGNEIDFDSTSYPNVAHSLACYHTLTTYLWLLNQQSSFGLSTCNR